MNAWQEKSARWISTACRLEVMSPKPGNVFPGSEFADSSVADFLASADAIAPVLSIASARPLGETILQAVLATRRVVAHNTNLGIILLLAPLAAVPAEVSLSDGIETVLDQTTVADSRLVYSAIQMAQPAGLGEVGEQDLSEEPSESLRTCMRLAADRDMIAKQYAGGFVDVLQFGLPVWLEISNAVPSVSSRISWLAVRLIAEFGDSLIARKCGESMSLTVQKKAANLLQSGWPLNCEQHHRNPAEDPVFVDFDSFLRADGNRRNPGTTADIVAAILFAALREGYLKSE